jgi:hypothetical protein
MNNNNVEILRDARGILLAFRKQDGERVRRAFAMLAQHEQPETLEMTVQGGVGLQWFKFRQLGLLVEKMDGRIIEVREKTF